MGGIVGGLIGVIDGDMIGQIVGGQIGRISIELSQRGCIWPLTHWQVQPAPDGDIERTKRPTAIRNERMATIPFPDYADASLLIRGLRVRTLLAILLLVDSSKTVQAEYEWSGNAFLPYCQAVLAQRGTSVAGVCLGYVAAASIYGRYMPEQLRNCVPPELPTGQKIRVVVKYLEDHPTRLHEPFGVLVMQALRAGWPCKR